MRIEHQTTVTCTGGIIASIFDYACATTWRPSRTSTSLDPTGPGDVVSGVVVTRYRKEGLPTCVPRVRGNPPAVNARRSGEQGLRGGTPRPPALRRRSLPR